MKVKIILISNYLPDQQESMHRFAQVLYRGLVDKDTIVEIWYPQVILGRLSQQPNKGFGKFLGYIDKWILYPIFLFFKLKFNDNTSTYIHICDHSNAPYIRVLPKNTSITCHDVLAIRSALGYSDTYCNTSKFGRYLQDWILSSLEKFYKIHCVSELTSKQLVELLPSKSSNVKVVHNPINDFFSRSSIEEVNSVWDKYNIPREKKVLLMVGSSLERKNRAIAIEIISELYLRNYILVFVGQSLSEVLKSKVRDKGLLGYVYEVYKPNHNELQALYSGSNVFLFPSFSEGFGWPVIEAQSCGTPVVASVFEPMPEVGGQGALYAHPKEVNDFIEKILLLENDAFRSKIVSSGYENVKRFSKEKILNEIKTYILS